ncbi:hypothetical protein [Pectobacterium versatile]|uniref:hypothetical protein n=1 Tax=Pectobacterium versatile TaxID=2488639 RepID=UPI001F45973D|nr:hypothetical protein [Pectobacterium versatile]
MAIGRSGRIVLEIDPEVKKKIYSILTLESLTLKDWFLIKVQEKIEENKDKSYLGNSKDEI